jgi:hypothetical protein
VLPDTVVFYLRLWLYESNAHAKARIDKIIHQPVDHNEELWSLIECWGELIADDELDVVKDERLWAESSRGLADAFISCEKVFYSIYDGSLPRDDPRSTTCKVLAHQMEFIVDVVWRAVTRNHDDLDRVAEDAEIVRVRTFMERHRQLIETVLRVPFASSAYELLGMLKFMAPADPRTVFHWVRALTAL